jgi:glyoxylase-like metal-dependent hydrolase (beta-lactamase superfamily II)
VTRSAWCDRPRRPAYRDLERVPVPGEWFAVFRVAAGVYAIHEPFQAQEVISYLIVGERQALLFDTGMGLAPIRPVAESLTRLPILVLNSHTHWDHVGGNAEFEAVLGVDDPYARENAGGWDHGAVASEVAPENVCLAKLPGFDPDAYRVRGFRADPLVSEGHLVDLGGRVLQVLRVPGHSPDSIALHEPDRRLLWSGDTFYEGPIWLFFPGTDLDAYARSVSRLAALAPSLDTVFPAHQTPVASPRRLVELQEAFAEVRAGRGRSEPRPGGLVEHPFGAFSFLMRPAGGSHLSPPPVSR